MLRRDDSAAATDHEASLFREVWASPEHHEAVAAFFEKRPAQLRP
jgi:enoyl-CoA hydratase/carnithine racemase